MPWKNEVGIPRTLKRDYDDITFDPFAATVTQGNFKLAEVQKEPVAAPKKKIVRCDKICKYFGGGIDGSRCKNKCSREPGHILNCKCRNHEMQ
jgi:hypothetical protein